MIIFKFAGALILIGVVFYMINTEKKLEIMELLREELPVLRAKAKVSQEDIAERIGIEVSKTEIVKELARLESPLFYTMYDAALAEWVEDFYYKIEDEDEEDED